MSDDALDDVRTFTQFAGAFVEVFAAGRTAIKHLARRNVVNRAAKISAGVGVEIGEIGRASCRERVCLYV